MDSNKKIGVLTSGGDAPGMNAAIRAVVRTAIYKGIHVVGIHHGYAGLLNKEIQDMDLVSVTNILSSGGSVLGSARSAEFKEDAGVEKGAAVCRELGIDGLVVIGGDGSFRGARDLSLKGIPCIGLPATIDNDIACTEFSIGFDTAVDTVHAIADRLRSTSQSHERCNLIEVMGQRSGDLALYSGIACGATAIFLPEVPFSIDEVVEKMYRTRRAGKRYFIIVVSEAVTGTKIKGGMSVFEMAAEIEKKSGVVSRATELGYAQRGGAPTNRDRILASEMGYTAVELLEKGIGNRVVVSQGSQIIDLDILEALKMEKPFNHRLYRIADAISI